MKKSATRVLFSFGAPAENRTPDTLIKSQVLYQLSYRGKLLSFCFAKMRRICYAEFSLRWSFR